VRAERSATLRLDVVDDTAGAQRNKSGQLAFWDWVLRGWLPETRWW